jgi:hypothetical protein
MMAKNYSCESFGLDGVFVVSGAQRRKLEPRFEIAKRWQEGFAWGRWLDPKSAHLPIPIAMRPMHPGAAQLAVAVLADYYGDAEVARRVYNRFAYRVFADRQPGPFVLLGKEIEDAVGIMQQVEVDEAVKAAKQRAAREMPMPVTEFGADVTWTKYEEPRVNKPE